jgi:hypothetical protein
VRTLEEDFDTLCELARDKSCSQQELDNKIKEFFDKYGYEIVITRKDSFIVSKLGEINNGRKYHVFIRPTRGKLAVGKPVGFQEK